MNNNIETFGVRILNVSPSDRSSNINVNSEIKVTFNAEINPATLVKNIVVFEDYNKVYKNINSLKDYSQYSVVKGSISYKDKTLIYTPNEAFKTDCCYIVVLGDGITDITGNKMLKKQVSCFYTESIASFPRCEIIAPKYGNIVGYIPEFEWKNQMAPSYIFQVSKSNTFELLLCDDIVKGNTISDTIKYTPVFNAKEGMYHIRVKSENGEWSDIHQIFIKEISDAIVAHEDYSEIQYLDEFLDGLEEPIEILEYFPTNGSINITLKTNIIYIKIKGKINEDLLRIEDSFVYGESFDEEHEDYAHETVDGKWTIIYDAYFDVTYVIFTPENLDDKEETEYIETLRSGAIIETKNTVSAETEEETTEEENVISEFTEVGEGVLVKEEQGLTEIGDGILEIGGE